MSSVTVAHKQHWCEWRDSNPQIMNFKSIAYTNSATFAFGASGGIWTHESIVLQTMPLDHSGTDAYLARRKGIEPLLRA